jgi:lysophospholipase L1-like esterase
MRGDRVHDDGLAEGISDGQRAEAQIQAAALDSEQPAQTISALRRNLCQDPYNQLYIVSDDKTQDGYLRFYAAASTAIAADTANPFGLPTCTLSASTKGRKFHLAEMGLAAGDVVSFGILGKWAATSSWYVYIVWRNSAGGSLGTASGTATAGTAALQFIDLVNLTVPATTVSVDFLLVRSAGSDNIDVYGWYCVQSTSVSGAWARELAYGQRSTDLGAWALKRERKPVPHANLERLWSWRNAQSRLYEAESDRHARVVCIGDSYTATPYRWVKPLAARLAADLGGGSYGTGFVSAHSDQYGAMTGMPKWTSVTRNGTWTQRAAGTGRGLDLCDATSTAGGDYYDLAGTFDTVRIHYLKQTGGGTFKTSVDGGSNWSANTDTNAADGFGVVEVTGCTNALRVYANGETVTMLGFVCYDTNVTNGIVVHKLGRSGATTAQWAAATANAVWQAALADLVPDLCIVWLGANTIGNAGASDVGYKADLLAIMGYIRTAQAALDTLLIAPPEHSTAHYTTFATYAARVRELAWEYPCGMIAMNQHIAYDTTDPLDLFEDATHINAYGGSLAAGVIYRALKW